MSCPRPMHLSCLHFTAHTPITYSLQRQPQPHTTPTWTLKHNTLLDTKPMDTDTDCSSHDLLHNLDEALPRSQSPAVCNYSTHTHSAAQV